MLHQPGPWQLGIILIYILYVFIVLGIFLFRNRNIFTVDVYIHNLIYEPLVKVRRLALMTDQYNRKFSRKWLWLAERAGLLGRCLEMNCGHLIIRHTCTCQSWGNWVLLVYTYFSWLPLMVLVFWDTLFYVTLLYPSVSLCHTDHVELENIDQPGQPQHKLRTRRVDNVHKEFILLCFYSPLTHHVKQQRFQQCSYMTTHGSAF